MAARWTFVCVVCVTFLTVNSQTTQTMNGTQVTQPSTADNNEESANTILDKSMTPLYDMVKGFLGVVQPNKIGEQEWLNISQLVQGDIPPGLFTEWQKISNYMLGFAVCFVVGILFCIIMPIVGCCFCCCRCCGRCGGKKKVHDPKRARCKRTSYCTILLALATIMLAGVVCAFVSNQLIHSYLKNENNQGPVGKIEAAFSGMKKYVDDTVMEVQQKALHAFDDTRSTLVNKINNTASGAVDRVADMLNASSLIRDAADLSDDVTKAQSDLASVSLHLTSLQQNGANLTQELSNIKTAVTNNCGIPCTVDVSQYDTDADFTMLSDLSAEAQGVSGSLNMSQYIAQANQTVQDVKASATNQIQTQINNATSALDNIRGSINTQINSFSSEIQNATKFATDASKTVNETMNAEVLKIFDYIWYGGIGVSSVYLLIVVCFYMGVLFGICGERPGYDAQCCNKGVGANFLMAGVGFSFLFSWLLMLLIAFFFLIGGAVHTEICRYFDAHNPQDLQFVSSAVSDMLRKSYKADIDLVTILEDCKQNEPVYDVLKLEQYVNLSALIDLSVVNDKIDALATVDFSVGNISLINPDLRAAINSFSTSGLDSINFTSFKEQMDKELTKVDLRVLAGQLRNASNQITDPTVNASLQAEAVKLEGLHNKYVVPMQADVAALRVALNSLEQHTSIQTRSQALIAGLEQAQNKFNTDSSTLVNELVTNLTRDLKDTTQENVQNLIADVKDNTGRCRPVFDSIYGLTDAVCVTMLNPFNTLWFSWGWCIFFFIPSIIFAVKLAGLYRREEEYTEKEFDDANFSMYGGPNTDTIPLTSVDTRHGGPGAGYPGMANTGYHYNDDAHHGGRNSYSNGYPHYDHRSQGSKGMAPPEYGGGQSSYPPKYDHDPRYHRQPSNYPPRY